MFKGLSVTFGGLASAVTN